MTKLVNLGSGSRKAGFLLQFRQVAGPGDKIIGRTAGPAA